MAAKQSGIYRSLDIVSLVILCLIMLAGFSLYILPHFGWRIDGLRSGSMAPQLMKGDVVMTHSVSPEVVEVGDIIAFYPSDSRESVVAHRVIGITTNSPLAFKTKGDANPASDPFNIPARNLVGRVAFHFPLLGYLVIFLKTAPGLLVVLVVPGLFIIGVCLKSLHNELASKKGKA